MLKLKISDSPQDFLNDDPDGLEAASAAGQGEFWTLK